MTLIHTTGLLAATLGLVKLLFDPQLKKHRWHLQFLGVVVGLGFAYWCSATNLATSPEGIVPSAVAIVPFALVSFWAVAYRESVSLRMVVFLGLIVVVTMLLSTPVAKNIVTASNSAHGDFLSSFDRLRASQPSHIDN